MIEKTKEILHVCIALLLIICLPLSAYPDAVDNWHWRSPFPYANHDLSAVCYGNGTFVAVGDKGTVLTSPDGITWTTRTSGSSEVLNAVSYGNNTFVTVGDKGTILNSPDGAAWTKGTSTSDYALNGAGYGNNTFVAVGSGSKYVGYSFYAKFYVILASPDGVTWTKTASDSSTSSSDNALNAVIYGSNIFVAVGYTKGSGMILTSPDGVTWTQRTSDSPAWFNAVGYGNNTFVVVGDKGTILTSYDGVTWTNRTSGVSEGLRGTGYGNNTFVVVGDKGTILTSPDTVTWTRRTSGTSDSLYAVSYVGNTFIAVGDNGTILTSSDGATWSRRISGYYEGLRAVSYGNGTLIAVGEGGTILQSDKLDSSVSLKIASPNGGETWLAGSSQTIKWQSSGLTPGGYVYVFYYDGSAWQYVAATPDKTSYTWQIPHTPTSGAYVWIGSWANDKWEAADISDGAFTISIPR